MLRIDRRRSALAVLILVTGSLHAPSAGQVGFSKVSLPTTHGKAYTTVTIGPDGKLYGAANDGIIRRWSLAQDGLTGAAETLSALRDAEGGNRLLIGMVFDPASTADNLVAWVTHSTYGFSNMPEWGGKVTRLSGPALETVQDIVIGLPRSSRDHVTNGITFGPDGLLYLLQGSNSTMGAPDAGWNNRPERLLSAAVLRLDPALVSSPPLDVRTDTAGSYDPYAAAAPLTIFAAGVRNAYDLVWASNGQLYVPTNGSANGGNTPLAVPGLPCADGGIYTGPVVPGLINVSERNDYLFRVALGGYYGHPNPGRCQFVLNGGNPTSGNDPAQVTDYPVGTLPDADYRGHAFDFGLHQSPDGIIEYRSCTFSGALRGRLLVVRYSNGNDIMILTPGEPNGDIVASQTGLPGMTGFSDPLDLCEDQRNGCLYVSEYAGNRIVLLHPINGGAARISGDIDADCDRDADDVAAFVGVLLGLESDSDYRRRSDFNGDHQVDGDDILLMAELGG